MKSFAVTFGAGLLVMAAIAAIIGIFILAAVGYPLGWALLILGALLIWGFVTYIMGEVAIQIYKGDKEDNLPPPPPPERG